MERAALHLEIRNALELADELSRHEHFLGDDVLAGILVSLRGALSDLEREIGQSHDHGRAPEPETVEPFERALEALLIRRDATPKSLEGRMRKLVGSAERVSFALWEPDVRVPSKPLLDVLPIARAIPEEVHAVFDYVSAAGFALSGALATTGRARAVAVVLAAGCGANAAMTDCRLSAKKAIPIEIHEILDHAGGAAAVAAPFLLGYLRKDPIPAAIHIGLGLSTIALSLFTDYRASKGITRPIRSRGGPEAAHRHYARGHGHGHEHHAHEHRREHRGEHHGPESEGIRWGGGVPGIDRPAAWS